METEAPQRVDDSGRPDNHHGHAALVFACFLIIATYVLMIDLKGVNTDEGLRLGIINAGQAYRLDAPPADLQWPGVVEAGRPYAYQPLYLLLQHTAMRLAKTQSEVFLKLVNIGFLWLALQGLLALSRQWALVPRLFLLGVFAFNAYLLMHVLQIREYIAAIAFYVWSTWFVLQLEARRLGRTWNDIAWFAAYGVLLTLGFYTQTWVVFPVLGQGCFLLVRRTADRWRFYAHLALSGLIVLAATVPYLRTNTQKADVGRWGVEGTALWPQLSDGFHLVFSGHPAGHSAFAQGLFWFWLAVILAAGLLFFRRRSAGTGTEPDCRREGLLMLLSLAFPLAFQVAYFYRFDNLSVWPRYFALHYFFALWVLALAFRYLHALAGVPASPPWKSRPLRAAVAGIWLVMLSAAGFQVHSYYRDPFLDSGMGPAWSWRTVAVGIARVLQPGDVMLVHEFLNRSTLTFTRPMPNRVLMLSELEGSDLGPVPRLVYLESAASVPNREVLAARLAGLGFGRVSVLPMRAPDGQNLMAEWQLLVFQR